MPTVTLTQALRDEYQSLFDTCTINSTRTAAVEAITNRLGQNEGRYQTAAAKVGAPWYFVGVIHNMESSLDFLKHLHNGDPLTARTVQVPAGRPSAGDPPFTWEQSAEDALRYHNVHKWDDWSLPGMLYQIEKYNGWGYRLYHPHVPSPYLWSYSNHYTSGKYVADGTWSDTAVSQQCGAAVVLRRMAEGGLVDAEPHVAADVPDVTLDGARPALRFSPNKVLPGVADLQAFMNQFPGIYLKADGKSGEKTSEAFKQLTGYYLNGDPRA